MLADPGEYMIANSTAGNAWAVQWPLIQQFARLAGVKAKAKRGGEFPHVQCGWSIGYVVGLKNRGSMDAHMGKTTRGGWYEEVGLCDQEALDLALGRGSAPGFQHILCTNPTAPRHWLKGYIDAAGERGAYTQHFSLEQNTTLDPRYVAYLRRIYAMPPP